MARIGQACLSTRCPVARKTGKGRVAMEPMRLVARRLWSLGPIGRLETASRRILTSDASPCTFSSRDLPAPLILVPAGCISYYLSSIQNASPWPPCDDALSRWWLRRLCDSGLARFRLVWGAVRRDTSPQSRVRHRGRFAGCTGRADAAKPTAMQGQGLSSKPNKRRQWPPGRPFR